MIGLLGGRRLLAPVLLGTMLAGGCQSTGTGSATIKQPGSADPKTPGGNAQPQGTATADGRRPNAATDQPSNAGRFSSSQDVAPAASTDPRIKLASATEAEYIPPSTTSSPYSPVPGSATRPEASVRIPAAPTGRVLTLQPGQLQHADETEPTPKVNTGGTESKSLEARMQQLEQRLQQRDEAVKRSGEEMQVATVELHRTRTHIEALHKELDEMRAKQNQRDKADIEALKKQIEMAERLEKLLGEESAQTEKRPGGEKKTDR